MSASELIYVLKFDDTPLADKLREWTDKMADVCQKEMEAHVWEAVRPYVEAGVEADQVVLIEDGNHILGYRYRMMTVNLFNELYPRHTI